MQVTEHAAVTIYNQLGGDRFATMTGAKDFVTSDTQQPRLTMRLPARETKLHGSHMEISLLPTDEYQMVFFKGRRGRPGERHIIEMLKGVQVDGLRSAFESMTGLRVSL